MKINWKAGLLVILLAVPAFLFLFLFFFGENQFDLPYLMNVGISDKGEIVLLEGVNDFDNPDFIRRNAVKASLVSDSLYLTFNGLDNNKSKSIKIIYDCINPKGPSEIQIAELKRIKEKVANKENIEVLFMYGADKNEAYFEHFYSLLETSYKKFFYPDGLLILVDSNNFFRGFYNPNIKADVDRLVTEYQILLDK